MNRLASSWITHVATSFLLLVLGCQEIARATALQFASVRGTTPVTQLTFRMVSPGNYHTCGVTTDNVAYCWGSNFYGELGDGTPTWHLTPVRVAGGLAFRTVSAGSEGHTCGVTTSGVAYCWGRNDYGQLGDGTTTQRAAPVAVAGGLVFRDVNLGLTHSCGVTTASVAYCWGRNTHGFLGDGTTNQRSTPTAVAGGLRFRAVSAGTLYTCGVTTGSAGYCWGSNAFGQLGDGTTTQSPTPVAVVGGLAFRSISAGGGHTCGTIARGAARCWGHNGYGQLGDGTTTHRSVPVAVISPEGVRVTRPFFGAVSAGGSHTCGTTMEGRKLVTFCWGYNLDGQLGDGTTIEYRARPAPVAGGLTFLNVSASTGLTCGVTTGSLAYCWGRNTYGQLGDGTTTTASTPVAVVSAAP